MNSYQNKQGFSLIEILLVIALMALITSVVLVNSSSLFKGLGDPPLQDQLKQAVRESRFQAAMNKEPVFLSFDQESGEFHITNEHNSILEKVVTGDVSGNSNLEIKFFRIPPERGIQRSLRRGNFGIKVKRVTFHPDRSSMPFYVHLIFDEDETLSITYDSFSDVVIGQETI